MDPNLPTGETMEEGDYSGAQSDVTLPASTFATTPKEGERLTFCVTGGDGENVTGYWMTKEPNEEQAWKDGLKDSMKGAV